MTFQMVLVMHPLRDRARAIAFVAMLAGAALSLVVSSRWDDPDGDERIGGGDAHMRSAADLRALHSEVVESPSGFYGDDGIFLRDRSSLEVVDGTRAQIERATRRKAELRERSGRR